MTGPGGLLMMGLAGSFLIVFLVVVHESGHFLFAKLFGVAAPVFSVGMGRRVWGFEWRGTDFRLSQLPVGGYVLLAGADPFGEEDPEFVVPASESFMHKPVWQRLVIMSAGPAFNLILPVILFTGVLMSGEPQVGPDLGLVVPETLAGASLQPGDRVRAVDGAPVEVWNDLTEALSRGGASAAWTVERDGAPVTVSLANPKTASGDVDWVALGVGPFRISAIVGVDDPASPAGIAGLRTGDRVLSVDGRPVANRDELMAALTAGAPHELTYQRLGFVDPEVPERCADQADNDLDGLVDCGDPECSESCPESEAAPSTARLEPSAYAGDGSVWSNAWGLYPADLFCGGTVRGLPAQAQGVQRGDRFLAMNGQEIRTFEQFVSMMMGSMVDGVAQRVDLQLRRGGETVAVSVLPQVQVVPGEAYSRPVFGAYSWYDARVPSDLVPKYYAFDAAAKRAVRETSAVIQGTAALLGNMFVARADPAKTVGGPVAIFHQAAVVAEEGLFPYVRLIGMISVSLGLINLLPVPVFDGGQILFYLFEAVRGRPLSLAIRERMQMVGVLALVVVFLLVTANDLSQRLGS